MKNLILILVSIFSISAFSCEISLPSKFSLATSPAKDLFFSYKDNQSETEIPVVRAFNCSKLAMTNKFLMIAFGPQNQEFTDRVGVFDFANDYHDRQCFINNNPFKPQDFAERNKLLQDKWHYIKTCYKISVEEEANTPLNMPAVQPGCSYERFGKNKMSFNGGFCYVKPSFGSSYLIRFNLNDSCKDFAQLANLKVGVSDIELLLNFYGAGEASGNSIDLSALNTFPVRSTTTPNGAVTSLSDDFGDMTPQFPGEFHLPDIHLGSAEAKDIGSSKTEFRLPFWVDNNCSKKCANGFCQSVCDYAQPIVANVEYFEMENGEEQFLTSWFEGGIAQPHYQGEISGIGFEMPSELVQIDHIYRVKAAFNDPKFDFERLKNRVTSKLGRLEQNIPRITAGRIQPIPETPTVGEINRIPQLDGVPALNFTAGAFNGVDRAVETLRKYLEFKLWPPYFDKICNTSNGTSCHGIKDNYLEFTMDFKVTGMDPMTKVYSFEILSVERKSELLQSYKKVKPLMPEIKCPF